MIKKYPNRPILKDHKKEGKKLIPPLMQLPDMKPVFFRGNMLPCLIWISAFFVRNNDMDAVQKPIKFLEKCDDILGHESIPPLVFLNNFDKLSNNQKKKLCNDSTLKKMTKFIWENICHQSFLFDDYPLSFLFKEFQIEISKEEAINRLKEDVIGLLDRHCEHATKVQTVAVVSMMITGKLLAISSEDIPDFNPVFASPNSSTARAVASFVRASLNAGTGFGDEEGGENEWSRSFWSQIFKLEGCQ